MLPTIIFCDGCQQHISFTYSLLPEKKTFLVGFINVTDSFDGFCFCSKLMSFNQAASLKRFQSMKFTKASVIMLSLTHNSSSVLIKYFFLARTFFAKNIQQSI